MGSLVRGKYKREFQTVSDLLEHYDNGGLLYTEQLEEAIKQLDEITAALKNKGRMFTIARRQALIYRSSLDDMLHERTRRSSSGT